MMRTIKIKPRLWKIAAMVAIIPSFLFVVACQDQVAVEDLKAVAAGSSVALDIPTEVQQKLDALRAAKPGVKYEAVEITTEEGKAALQKIDVSKIASLDILTKLPNDRTFAIIEMNSATLKASESLVGSDKVFTVVEDMPSVSGGTEAFMRYISREVKYPLEARKQGVQGNVFVSFIVGLDGKVSDPQVLKSVHPELDAEAVRVVAGSPDWTPGKQNGQPVKVRMVVPIKYRLSDQQAPNTGTTPSEANGANSTSEIVVLGYKPQ